MPGSDRAQESSGGKPTFLTCKPYSVEIKSQRLGSRKPRNRLPAAPSWPTIRIWPMIRFARIQSRAGATYRICVTSEPGRSMNSLGRSSVGARRRLINKASFTMFQNPEIRDLIA